VTSNQGETIVAVATPAGKGAIAVIRLSGPQALRLVAQRLGSQSPLLPRRPSLQPFLDSKGVRLDQVLVTLFPPPASYTGEEVVEISCHGSRVVVRQIVETLLEAGARLAEPGEFSLRAFLNGKMDLAQAEALRDLIESQTSFQAKLATEQLHGTLSRKLASLKDEIVRVLCHIETALEFVEDEVEPQTREQLMRSLREVDGELQKLEESFSLGRVVQEGITVSIVGKPNVGKSCLFNSLLLDERAIVTDIPGTTRDALAETINLDGIPTRLVDTAGIRDARDYVKHLGVQKSLEFLHQSDVVLFVVDRAVPFEEEDQRIWELIQKLPCIVVLNKEDLTSRVKVPVPVLTACAATVNLSALKRTHLQELRSALLEAVVPEGELEREAVLVSNIRHKRCIEEARNHLRTGLEAYQSGLSEEFPVYDFRKALQALGQITGETTVEDILEQIFSTFCIGK
jgi:tRNA modification GTPase